jgi:hypothetical protein
MKKLVLLTIICFAFAGTAYAEQFNVTYISLQPKSIKVFKKDDNKYLWQYVTQARTLETGLPAGKAGGRTMLKITENCKGIWNDRDERTWESESYYFYENKRVVPDRAALTFYDLKGKVADKIEKKYSAKDGKVYCVKNGEKKEYDFDDDLVDKEVLGVCMMNFSFGRKEDFDFHMMTNEPAHYRMTMVNRGIEAFNINGATVECWKIQMVPDLGFLGIFAPFVPKTYFWYKVASPHEFVRYEGLESGLNTPYIVMQAVDK